MRELSVSTLVTLDGVIQDPGGFGETAHGGATDPYRQLAQLAHLILRKTAGPR